MTFPNTHKAEAWMSLTLSALNTLTTFPGQEVKHKDLMEHIASLPGFPGWGHWGTAPMGKKTVQRGFRAVSLAAGKLKSAGEITSPRRGYFVVVSPTTTTPDLGIWATDAGLGSTAPAPEPVAAPEPAPEPTPAPAPAPEPAEQAPGVVFDPAVQARSLTVRGYDSDPALRAMKAANTRCFGSFSPRSSPCADCPLAGACWDARVASFSRLQADLNAAFQQRVAEEEARLAEEQRLAQEREAARLAAAQVAEIREGDLPEGAEVIQAPFPTPCASCGTDIPRGDHYVFIKGRGCLHPRCVGGA